MLSSLGHRPRPRGPLLAVRNVGLFPTLHLVSCRRVSRGLEEGSWYRNASWEGVPRTHGESHRGRDNIGRRWEPCKTKSRNCSFPAESSFLKKTFWVFVFLFCTFRASEQETPSTVCRQALSCPFPPLQVHGYDHRGIRSILQFSSNIPGTGNSLSEQHLGKLQDCPHTSTSLLLLPFFIPHHGFFLMCYPQSSHPFKHISRQFLQHCTQKQSISLLPPARASPVLGLM